MSLSWLQVDVSYLEITIEERTTDEVTLTLDVVAGIIEDCSRGDCGRRCVVTVEMLDCDVEVGFVESTLFCSS